MAFGEKALDKRSDEHNGKAYQRQVEVTHPCKI
jgi:hypothetical protein